MPSLVGNARYFPWDGGSVFVGRSGEFPVHAHQAIQVCFLFDGPIRLRTTNEAPWVEHDVAVIPSREPHGMLGSASVQGAVIFVEPETREGRILAERFPSSSIANLDRQPVAPGIAALRGAWFGNAGAEALVRAARRVVQGLTGELDPAVVSDERILRAVAWINANLSTPLTLKQVAAVAHLSPGRFRHLFAEQTGSGLRQYILWRRFVRVWEHTMRGDSLSAAAHAAGFADSAHLTRTCRRMMGIPPSALDMSADPTAGG